MSNSGCPSRVMLQVSAPPNTQAIHRSSVGHFSQSCWTKELSIGKLQNRNSEQFGSGVGYWEKHIRIGLKPTHILTFARCFPCFGNDEVGSSILPSSTIPLNREIQNTLWKCLLGGKRLWVLFGALWAQAPLQTRCCLYRVIASGNFY